MDEHPTGHKNGTHAIIIMMLVALLVVETATLGYVIARPAAAPSPVKSNVVKTVPVTTTTPIVASDTPANIDTLTGDESRGLHSYIRITSQGTEYTSDVYGFSLVLPTSWGMIHEKEDYSPEVTQMTYQVTLSAQNDPARYITIQVVADAHAKDPMIIDYPNTFITSKNGFSYYYVGGGDNAGRGGIDDPKQFEMLAETSAIIKTFKAK